jgi:Domain of unknown function (DUF4149)
MVLSITSVTALLLSSLLFGGMVLFSFGFAVFVLKHLPTDVARSLIRKAFPIYYLLVAGVAVLAGLAALPSDPVSAAILLTIAVTTIAARQGLMLSINAATDRGDRRAFAMLHGLSVLLQIGQIVAAAIVLVRF